jgi:hypothetical protein
LFKSFYCLRQSVKPSFWCAVFALAERKNRTRKENNTLLPQAKSLGVLKVDGFLVPQHY